MVGPKSYYKRYWKGENIAVNSFDCHPGEWTKENFEYHMEFFKPFIKGRLLDFGCGNGQFMGMVSPYCEDAYGIDVCEDVLEVARRKYPNIKVMVLDEEEGIPFTNNYFDTVCVIDVLEHILDTETTLEEIYRVLKPNGKLLIATNELTRIKHILIALCYQDNYFYPTSPHIRYFTKRNLSDLLHRKGFQILHYKKNRTYFGFIPQGQMMVASKLP